MPAFASITIKKNDGTTDATYVGKTPSGGDVNPAQWRYDTHPAPYAGLKPELRMAGKWNGPKTARRMTLDYVYRAYVTDSTTGVSSILGSIPFTISAPIPVGIPQADIDEAVSQCANLFGSTLVKNAFKEGFAP